MINRSVLVGRLTKDPELKYTQSGIAVARFTLAVNRTFSNSAGDREADFIQVVVWRKQAENASQYLKKGHLAGVEGRIQTGSYDDNDGKRVFTTEVVADSVQFLEPRSGGNSGQQQSSSANTNGSAAYSNGNGATHGSNYQSAPSNTQYSGPVNAGTAVGNDPFSDNGNGGFTVSDDDLPF